MVVYLFISACLKKIRFTAPELYLFSFIYFSEEVIMVKIFRYPKSSTFLE